MNADIAYQNYIKQILSHGDRVNTRNHETLSCIDLPPVTFTKAPLVQLRKTAWKKAISEMEWFLSGQSDCPDNLLDWWSGQLNDENCLISGYGWQFRRSSFLNSLGDYDEFDQIKFILDGLKNNPYSRRLIIDLWNPGEMANITKDNENPSTPTVCHSVLVQFFVRNGELHMKSYQRSADMLLGVPHNWIQSWAMLLYFAHHSNLGVGSMTWIFGDAHIYQEESHIEVAKKIANSLILESNFNLLYQPSYFFPDTINPNIQKFVKNNFKYEGSINEPCTTIRPKII